VKKCLPEAAVLKFVIIQDFFHNQSKSSHVFGADEETYIFAAFCRSFLHRRLCGCAKKVQRDQAGFSQKGRLACAAGA